VTTRHGVSQMGHVVAGSLVAVTGVVVVALVALTVTVSVCAQPLPWTGQVAFTVSVAPGWRTVSAGIVSKAQPALSVSEIPPKASSPQFSIVAETVTGWPKRKQVCPVGRTHCLVMQILGLTTVSG
jgi:hypothetical protein